MPECAGCMEDVEDAAEGFAPGCCDYFVCKDCIAQGGANALVVFALDGTFKCPSRGCGKAYESSIFPELIKWGVPENLLNPPQIDVSSKYREAWNFKLYHGCGYAIQVFGWSECDVLAGNCPTCKKRWNMVGADGESFQLRGLFNDLTGFHDRASPATFAALKGKYPNAWNALCLSSLIDAAAGDSSIVKGELTLWPSEAQAFLIAKAKDVKAKL